MKLSDEKGTALIEFALVLPLLLVVTSGIIEFGFAIYDKAMITNASREGARAGIAFGWPDDYCGDTVGTVETVVNNYLQERLINFGESSATVTPQVVTETFGRACSVTVNYRYQFLVLPNLLRLIHGGLSDGGINLDATTIMRMENQDITGA